LGLRDAASESAGFASQAFDPQGRTTPQSESKGFASQVFDPQGRTTPHSQSEGFASKEYRSLQGGAIAITELPERAID
jgi:hypothetical protein